MQIVQNIFRFFFFCFLRFFLLFLSIIIHNISTDAHSLSSSPYDSIHKKHFRISFCHFNIFIYLLRSFWNFEFLFYFFTSFASEHSFFLNNFSYFIFVIFAYLRMRLRIESPSDRKWKKFVSTIKINSSPTFLLIRLISLVHIGFIISSYSIQIEIKWKWFGIFRCSSFTFLFLKSTFTW